MMMHFIAGQNNVGQKVTKVLSDEKFGADAFLPDKVFFFGCQGRLHSRVEGARSVKLKKFKF